MHGIPGGATLLDKQRDDVPPDLVWDAENPMKVNSCTGSVQMHVDSCDGQCNKLELDELDIKVENERRAWSRIGMDTAQYNANQLRQDVQIQTMIQLIQTKLNIMDEEFNEIFKKNMLEMMTSVRMSRQALLKEREDAIFVATTPPTPKH